MTPPESARMLAMARLRERARRIGRMRKSVVATGVATFVLAWGLALNDQLAHGTKTSPGSTSSDQTSTTSSTNTSEEFESDDDDGLVVAPQTAAPTPAPSPAPAPVTSSQS